MVETFLNLPRWNKKPFCKGPWHLPGSFTCSVPVRMRTGSSFSCISMDTCQSNRTRGISSSFYCTYFDFKSIIVDFSGTGFFYINDILYYSIPLLISALNYTFSKALMLNTCTQISRDMVCPERRRTSNVYSLGKRKRRVKWVKKASSSSIQCILNKKHTLVLSFITQNVSTKET